MNRWKPARRGSMLLAMWCACLACEVPPRSAGADLPNVVLITADDLGWLDLPVYGNPDLSTPHIDRLAREGVRFTRAFVAAPSCSSSRASIMTGQYPHTNGVTGLAHRHLGATLSPFRDTLADLLSAAGYETGLAGKWHVAPYLPAGWYGYNERLSGLLDPWIRDMDPILDFITRHQERPFYLEINFMNTHREDSGEFEFDPAFPVDPDAVQVSDYLQLPDWPEVRHELAKFYSQTMGMDAMIGDVLRTLDRLDLAKNTLVLFVSDNGPPFPGSKMTLYDRGIATPLIVRWPARVPAGSVRHAMLSTVDILPTLLESIGQSVPEWVQGRSFLPLLARGGADTHRDAIFAQMTNHVDYIPTRAVRTKRFKYIRNYSDIAIGLDQLHTAKWAHRLCDRPDQPWKRPRPREELYDLVVDPNEQTSLIDDPSHQPILEELRKRLDTHMQQTADPFLDAPFGHDHDPRAYEPR
ncbi:MAG: sulfatase [bacterium]|nr:sulfatase [bacterium]MCP5065052.1 sulfatase [bacterium]